MTVFCPNCGKPNTDTAEKCIACSTALKQTNKGRFKGTMMMTGVGGSGAPGAPTPGAPPGAPPPAAQPAPAPTPAPAAGGGPVQAGSTGARNMAFQATMLGPMTPPPGAGALPPAGGSPPAGGGFGAPPGGAPAGGGFGAPPGGAPAGGGFGAPPGGAPAGGGFGAPPPAGGGFGAPPPAGGGFGAPPGGAPAGGGFGAPPGGAPAGGGFGAPPGGAPAGGGFGAPPGGAPAGGGFGAPPPAGGGFGASPTPAGGFGAPPSDPGFGGQPAAASGGFGAPPGGQPPQGGGFGPPPGGGGGFGPPPGGAPPGGGFGPPPGGQPPGGFAQGATPVGPAGGEPPKKKTWLWVGLGCLVFTIVGSIAACVACKFAAEAAVEQGGQTIIVELNRAYVVVALQAFSASCPSDPTGTAAGAYIHDPVAPALRPQACLVTPGAITAFGNAATAPGAVLTGTADEGRATALGLTPSECVVFTSGAAKIVVCNTPVGQKIIHLEGLNTL